MFSVCGLKVIFCRMSLRVWWPCRCRVGMGVLLSTIVRCRMHSSVWGVIRQSLN